MRLVDFVSAVPADIEKGIILGKTKETNIVFTSISHLTAQFKLDYVIGFDIVTNKKGKRIILIRLAHWGD